MNSNSSTKTIVATGLGAALFLVLFMFVKIPSPVPETNLQIAYGVSGFFAALYGPLCGFLIAFIGHSLNDFIAFGAPWWSWIVASGVSALITGFCFKKVAGSVENGQFGSSEMKSFGLWTLLGQGISWILIAPVLDIVLYAEPAGKVFTQGGVAFVADFLSAIIIGGLLLKLYAASKVGKGTLSKNQ